MQGRTPAPEKRNARHNLTSSEEETIVRYIIDLDSRGFPPRIDGVEDMANLLLATRHAKRVGKHWPYRFVQRRPELKTRFSRSYDFQRALCEDPSNLDIRLRTPTPTGPSLPETDPWVSQTPHNPTEAISQSKYVQDRISRHQGSSPTQFFPAVTKLAKGTEAIAHEVTLLQDRVRTLEKANETLSKRRKAKRTRVQAGGALTVEDAQGLVAQKDADRQKSGRKSVEGGSEEAGPSTLRHCGKCGRTGHNVRTCQEVEEMSDEDNLID